MKKIKESFTDFYAERFANPKEFVRTLKKRLGKGKMNRSCLSGLKNECGISSFEEVYSLLLNGWGGYRRDIDAKFDERVEELRKEMKEKSSSEVIEKTVKATKGKKKHQREVCKKEFVLGIEKRNWPWPTEETERRILIQLA